MGSAADRAFGEVDNDVTEEEIRAMTRLGATIGNGVGRNVAERYATAQTVEILEHFGEILPDWASGITLSMVRADKTRVRAGGSSQLFATSDLIDKAKSHDEVAAKLTETTEALKQLEDAANNTTQTALPAASSTDPVVDAAMEKLRPLVAANPNLAEELFKLFASLGSVTGDDQLKRFAVARDVLNARNGYELIDDGNGVDRPKNYVTLLKAKQGLEDEKRVLEQDKTTLTADLNKATLELDVNKPNSIGWKAKAYDYHSDVTIGDSWISERNKAIADLGVVQQELDDAKDVNKNGSWAHRLADVSAQLADERDPNKDGLAKKAKYWDKFEASAKKAQADIAAAKKQLDRQRSLPMGATKPAEDAKVLLDNAALEVSRWSF